jgi:hypothetical protein
VLIFTSACCNKTSKESGGFPVLSGPYLGQEPPADTPTVFAPGLISLGFHELSLTFSADGSDIVYIMADHNGHVYSMIHVEETAEGWTKPQLLPFSSFHRNYACQFDPVRDVFYFSSNRPLPGHDSSTGHHIWQVERLAEGWGEATLLDAPGNVSEDQSCPSPAASGNLYFLRRPEDSDRRNIFVYKYRDGVYSDAVPLGSPVNSDDGEGRPFVAPDESFLLFQANLEGGFGSMDIYVSFRMDDTTWGRPINLGERINTDHSEFGPRLSPDGKYLFFSSYRGLTKAECESDSYDELLEIYRRPENGYATLYWVDASIIKELQPGESK